MSRRFIPMVSALALVAGISGLSSAQVFDGGIPPGFTCIGNCGVSGADGVVTLAPQGGTQFGWISSLGGPTMNVLGVPDIIFSDGQVLGVTNGSLLTSALFSATAGQALSFRFNYVTSDGVPYNDFAFVRLLRAGFEPLVLFTARTAETGNTVPGQDLPGIAPGVTLSPATSVVIAGAPNFSPLGPDQAWNNTCYYTGCGFTGWIRAQYTIAVAGTYQLQFGVNNFLDEIYDSALAIDYGLGAGGTPETPEDDIGDDGNPAVVPEPATWVLMASGLAAVGVLSRRRRVR